MNDAPFSTRMLASSLSGISCPPGVATGMSPICCGLLRYCGSRRTTRSNCFSPCTTSVATSPPIAASIRLLMSSTLIHIDRARIARYGINVDDINNLIEAAIGGDVATEVVQGEKQFDLVVRLLPQYRNNPQQIGDIPV